MEKNISKNEIAFEEALKNYKFDIIEEFRRTGHAMFYQDINGIEYSCELISENTILLKDYLKDMNNFVGCGNFINYEAVNIQLFTKPISTKELDYAKIIANDLLK
ncbi:MAG: hypothetical protein U0V72_12420 [Cytophagales bacterium]